MRGPAWLLWLCAAVSILAWRQPARAEESRRYALFVGQNDGGPGTHRLLYAEQDAVRLRDLMTRIGAIAPGDATLLRGPSRERVLAGIRGLEAAMRRDRSAGRRAVLLFYYSGHAEAQGLKLGATVLSMLELKQALKAAGADLRLVLLDACQSGAATRSKGGSRAPSFLVQVDDGADLTGEVVITSSAADEASQESDRIGGGYFTHHLVSGLLGAADASRDGQVTLDEAYAYAYHQTLFETAGSSGGMQHPSYSADLRGHGTLVLTRPEQGQTVLVFPTGLEGQYLVFDRNRRLFVAELLLSGHEERRLALPAGKYLIQKRQPDHLLTAEVLLTRGVMKQLDARSMTRTGFEEDFSRGVAATNVWRATRSPVYVGALAGFQHFALQPPGTTLFPDMPLFGIEVEWRDLVAPGWSIAADLQTGSRDAVLDFETYDIPSHYREYLLGVGLKWGKRFGAMRLSAGPRLSGVYLQRSFPDSAQPFQDYAMVTPGGVAEVGLELGGRLSVGLEGRGSFLYYRADGQDYSLGYADLLLRASVKF